MTPANAEELNATKQASNMWPCDLPKCGCQHTRKGLWKDVHSSLVLADARITSRRAQHVKKVWAAQQAGTQDIEGTLCEPCAEDKELAGEENVDRKQYQQFAIQEQAKDNSERAPTHMMLEPPGKSLNQRADVGRQMERVEVGEGDGFVFREAGPPNHPKQ